MKQFLPLKDVYNTIRSLGTEVVNFWQSNNARNADRLQNVGTYEEYVRYCSTNFDFTIDGIAPRHLSTLAEEISRMKEVSPGVVYSDVSKFIDEGVIRDGMSINHCQTNIMRHRLNSYYNLKNCTSILEIGAGYGAFAREILKENTNIKYVIIDLPETLMGSYAYLNLEFPEKTHIVVSDPNVDISNFDILYIPVGALDFFVPTLATIPFDLFVNTCSLGEMKNHIIQKYYTLVTNQCNVKAVYWLNRFLNNQGDHSRRNENGCMALIPDKWHVKNWENMPAFLKTEPIMQYHAKMVEIFATIEKTVDSIDNSSHIRDPLFLAWNKSRLHPSRESYSDTLLEIRNINPTAEEIWYYEDTMNLVKAQQTLVI